MLGKSLTKNFRIALNKLSLQTSQLTRCKALSTTQLRKFRILKYCLIPVTFSQSRRCACSISCAVTKPVFIMDEENSPKNQEGVKTAAVTENDPNSEGVCTTWSEHAGSLKAGTQVKHKFEQVFKGPLNLEQANKKLKLDGLADAEKSSEKLHEIQEDEMNRLASCEDLGQSNVADVSADNTADGSVSMLDESSIISDVSDGAMQPAHTDAKETEKKDRDINVEAISEKSSKMDQLSKERQKNLQEKIENIESRKNQWWEAMSKIPDQMLRLKACQESEDFKELVNDLKKIPKKNKGMRRYKSEKVYPNHFISLQITNEQISSGIKKVQESILEKNGELSSAMINPATLHLTLMVMHLTEEQLPKATEILEDAKNKINNSAWISEQIEIFGIGTFRGEVVFGKVKSDDGHKQLEFMKDVVSKCYLEGGISSTDKRKGFNPHLTIMKLSKARKGGKGVKVKKIPAAYFEEFADHTFGEQPLQELQLCAMMKPKDANGYYHVEHRIDINKPASQGDGQIYFEKLEKNLDWVVHEPEIDPYPFFGQEFPFSNHHEAEFSINGIRFTTSEQWYMFCKAMFHEQYDLALRVLETSNPKAQKRLCSILPPDHNGRSWNATAKRVMTIGVTAKFTQNKHLADALLNTGDKVLVEASPFDCRWGIGLRRGDPRVFNRNLWRGENWLGQILMAVREGIRKGRLSVNEESSVKVAWDVKDLPVIIEPQDWCDIFTWNEDDLPVITCVPP